MTIQVNIDLRGIKALQKEIPKSVKELVRDVGDSLAMTASGAAPHDEGILEKSYDVSTFAKGSIIASALVGFHATNKGFDYSLMMHDGDYNLGPGSRDKSGGYGLSGAIYSVGRKYLHRPLYGEEQTYSKYINDELVKVIESYGG